MTEHQPQAKSKTRSFPIQPQFVHSHYGILGVHPSASVIEIRQAYRKLSKEYHPDTTNLSSEVATAKFQQLNEAYGILSHPQRRSLYDLEIGYSRWTVIQPRLSFNHNSDPTYDNRSAYLDPSDRPLSAGEIFALILLALTFGGCLLLVLILAMVRGDTLTPDLAIFFTIHYGFACCGYPTL
ncbi:MAG: J domain-containing protein [Microcystaceae cyanobacterium]